MDTRTALTDHGTCVYCGAPSLTRDHAPPRCLLTKPLPSNLITLPACAACNCGFSFEEGVVRAVLAAVGSHPDLVAQRGADGSATRALARDKKLKTLLDACWRTDGKFEFSPDVGNAFKRVLTKTVQGLYFGLYARVVPAGRVQLRAIVDQREVSPEQMAEQVRPSGLHDITDEPVPSLSPSGWVTNEPLLFMDLMGPDGRVQKRVFHIVRETEIEWVTIQPGVFRFAFVKSERGGAVCVLDLWQSLTASVAVPWPDDRGPMRKGKRNPLSRE